jgi:hypothetical protein
VDTNTLQLPVLPVQSVTSVTYVQNGATVTLPSTDYTTDKSSGRISPVAGGIFPSTAEQIATVAITYKAGYSLSTATVANQRTAIPAEMKLGVLNFIMCQYDNRSGIPDKILEQLERAVTGNRKTLLC